MFLYEHARAKEIIEATKKIYETKAYREINIKEISQATSMSRPSIYNYFQTKEEIFLVILALEYEKFSQNIGQFVQDNKSATKDEAARFLAKAVEERDLMLKILSNNLEDFEVFSRMEVIVYFKRAFLQLEEQIDSLLKTTLDMVDEGGRKKFIYQFLPYLFGVYIYTHATEKQKEAFKQVNSNFTYFTVYELMYSFVKQLLSC